MSLRAYNSLTKQKELFEPVQPGKVGMYLCGPTVYKPPHIGHMVGPVVFDAIKRYLQHKGFDVTWVVNITDVDDKLIDAAKKVGSTVQALADRYTAKYMECLKGLGIDTINHFPKASEHIQEIIEMIQVLIEKENAYPADGNVWFDVATDPEYGKLSNRTVAEQEGGLRTTEGTGKRNPADFALWKAAKPGEPSWESPWGPGRPGWHIECSAMSIKYLGPTFDFHGGGLDLMFPHHENELAQSECATGKPFARYWLHNGLTRVNTKKISGSDAATAEGAKLLASVAARKLIDDSGAELLRYFLLSTHYRSPIEFTEKVMEDARKGHAVFERLFERVDRLLGQPLSDTAPDLDSYAGALLESDLAPFAKAILGLKMKFMEMMDDDFNTAGAIAVMHEMAGEINSFIEQNQVEKNRKHDRVQALAAATVTLRKLGLILNLFHRDLAKSAARQETTAGLASQLMDLLIRLRQEARQSKNFALADSIRKGLAEIGVTLEDRADGTGWRKE
jgi:cysteinyl-tRNA synthetase